MGKRICAERAATAPLRVGQHFAQLKPFPILALGALACQVIPATVTAGLFVVVVCCLDPADERHNVQTVHHHTQQCIIITLQTSTQ